MSQENLPIDYEPCGECGFDHSYEPAQAAQWHSENCSTCGGEGIVELSPDEQAREQSERSWRTPDTMKPCPECCSHDHGVWAKDNYSIK